jgi:Tol biopolymer transport system component
MLAFGFNPSKNMGSTAPGDIFTVNADGSGLRRLTFGLDASSPSWSPDGKRLAYLRTDWRHNYATDLWLMNADGSGQRRLSSVGHVLSAPDWSPDGKHIAVAEGERWIVVLDLPSLHKRRMGLGVRRWSDPEWPRWSADGRHLLVDATKNGPGADDYTSTMALFTMDAVAGGRGTQVPGTKDLMGHDWSWTSCRAVLGEGLDTRGGEGNGDLFATNATLTSTEPVLVAKGRQSFPTWSPDGQRIAYLNHGGLWIANADGGDANELVPPQTPSARSAGSTAAIHRPDWQPVP